MKARFTGAAADAKLKAQRQQQQQSQSSSLSNNTPSSAPKQFSNHYIQTSASSNISSSAPKQSSTPNNSNPALKHSSNFNVSSFAPQQSYTKSFNEMDETLYYLQEKVRKILIYHTACQTISSALLELHNVDILETMKQCKVQTPIELFQLMGFTFDKNGCFKSYEAAIKS